MSNEITLTYTERAAKMTAQEESALVTEIAKDFKVVEESAHKTEQLMIVGCNAMRRIGCNVQILTGHEQISVSTFEGLKKKHGKRVPKKLSFNFLKCCVHVSHKIDKDVTTAQEAMQLQKDLFIANAQYSEPKRLAEQTAHDVNPWSELISKGAAVIAFIVQMQEDEPMENWSKDKLDSFVQTYKPLVTTYHAAEALLK
jgi:hypothetical protein